LRGHGQRLLMAGQTPVIQASLSLRVVRHLPMRRAWPEQAKCEGRCWASLEGGNRGAHRGSRHRQDDYGDLSVGSGARDGDVGDESVVGSLRQRGRWRSGVLFDEPASGAIRHLVNRDKAIPNRLWRTRRGSWSGPRRLLMMCSLAAVEREASARARTSRR
jgi:hypothetical protein